MRHESHSVHKSITQCTSSTSCSNMVKAEELLNNKERCVCEPREGHGVRALGCMGCGQLQWKGLSLPLWRHVFLQHATHPPPHTSLPPLPLDYPPPPRALSPTRGLSQMYRSPDTTALVGRLKGSVRDLRAERDALMAQLSALKLDMRWV